MAISEPGAEGAETAGVELALDEAAGTEAEEAAESVPTVSMAGRLACEAAEVNEPPPSSFMKLAYSA